MIKTIISTLVALIVVSAAANTYAGWVNGYSRSNGTYVQGHYRSNPDSHKWNNYGPSSKGSSSYDYKSRDHDRDGVSNAYDMDDDNDGILDDYDSNQYGR